MQMPVGGNMGSTKRSFRGDSSAIEGELATHFLAALARSSYSLHRAPSQGDLSAQLEAAVSRARERWPAFRVSAISFVRWLALRLSPRPAEPLEAVIECAHIEDLWLAHACLHGDTRAHRELERVVRSVAQCSGAINGLTADRTDDFLAAILESLLVGRKGSEGKLASYSGRGGLSGWLWTLIYREAIHFKKRQVRDEPFEEAIQGALLLNINGSDPELGHIRAECQAAFCKSFRAALLKLDDQARLLLRYWICDGLTLEEVGRITGAHRVTVVRWVREIRTSLLKNTLLELGRDLSLDRNEAESVLRVLDSRLDASFSGAVG
jgi:RNA polymerase sigma-70 factor, ECF subfamily